MQGNINVIWSAISEIKGRKVCNGLVLAVMITNYGFTQLVYLSSIALFALCSAIVAKSQTIDLIIGMRILQGIGYVLVYIHIRFNTQ